MDGTALYTFYSDPGHAWLEVPVSELRELEIEDTISNCSYLRGPFAYLEEDCDAPKFVIAFEARFGHKPKWTENYQDPTPIRRYHSYSKP